MDLSSAHSIFHALVQGLSTTQWAALGLALISGIPVGWALYRPRSPR